MGPIVTDIILAVVGVLMTGWFTSLIIQLGGFYIFNQGNTSSENIADCGSFSSALIYMLPLFMFVSTIPYVIERLQLLQKKKTKLT